MDLSIIVTSYKSPHLLKLCLNSIMKNIKDITYEVIVADGETQEDTEMMMREEYPWVTFISVKKNVGFQALLKRGIGKSRAKHLLLLNGDILVKPRSVESLLAYIKSDTSVGMIAPKLLNFDGSLQYSCFRFYKPITILYRRTFLGKMRFAQKHIDWFLMKDYDHAQPRDVDWVMGSALMVSRKALKKVGYMDRSFFMYMEDVDWCRRFWEKGYKVIYYPDAQMLHYHGKGSQKGGVVYSLLFNRLTWSHIRSAAIYFRKYAGKKPPHQELGKDDSVKR